jgi:hypothetical protein
MVFSRFRKTAKSDYQLRPVCLSACQSVRMELLGSHWSDFNEILYLSIFRKKMCRENSSFIKIWQNQRVLYMKTRKHF